MLGRVWYFGTLHHADLTRNKSTAQLKKWLLMVIASSSSSRIVIIRFLKSVVLEISDNLDACTSSNTMGLVV